MTNVAKWWEDHSNIVLLTAYLASEGFDATEVADAVEKPWKYQDEFDAAVADHADEVRA